MGKKFFNAVDRGIRIVISVLLFLMTAAIFYQVVLRYVFHASNIWAEEFARYAFVWVVMLGSACAVRRYKHIRVDVLVDRMPAGLRRWVEIATYLIMLATLVILAGYGISIASRTAGLLSAGLHVSKGFMYSSIPTGCILMGVFVVEILIDDFILKKGSAETLAG